ncbi:hypothetical protein OS493_014124 [Desmophyllum pertusum]|uniref:Uncharacterized protein n=1 Tax=Desmophyllum pertusum TaxID=174260 RepID=A0A9W9ZFK0_9CNID|nr:hypothetical protein OS493_014124 [Desmophyllum pertusum]
MHYLMHYLDRVIAWVNYPYQESEECLIRAFWYMACIKKVDRPNIYSPTRFVTFVELSLF